MRLRHGNETYPQTQMNSRKDTIVNRLRAKLAQKEVKTKHREAYTQYLTIAKENAYEAYCEGIKTQNEKHGTQWKPHPMSDFQWTPCCLCGGIIADDPYGHNPFPLCEVEDADAKACSKCNADHVIPARIVCMKNDYASPEEAREACRQMEAEIRASHQR